ncbi:MAG TPA: L,D-transpeptidase [Solirubrobacterales bacterium]
MIDAPLPRPLLAALGLLLSVAAMLCLGVTGALAAGGSAEIEIARTNGIPQNAGAPTQYSINFSCSGVEATTCGEEPQIRIPLVLTSALGETPAMETWTYAASSGIAGLVKEKVIEGGELVLKLDPTKLIPGESDTIQRNVTPPNGITPNGTAWSLTATFQTEEIEPVLAKSTATGEAVSTAPLAVSKKTLDEGAVYVRGHQVIFNITAQCSPGATTGKLFMTEGSLADLLPGGLARVLKDFGGGPGWIAIHGRDGESLLDPLGSAASHGCIRIPDAGISWLAAHAPLGTPVRIFR